VEHYRIEQRGQSTLRQLLPLAGRYPESSSWGKSFRSDVSGLIDGDTVAELSAICV
jgi:hypothetical protein